MYLSVHAEMMPKDEVSIYHGINVNMKVGVEKQAKKQVDKTKIICPQSFNFNLSDELR